MNFVIEMPKDEILAKLESNMQKHAETYIKAKVAWNEAVRVKARELVAALEDEDSSTEQINALIGELSKLSYNMPKEMSDTYKEAIGMISAHVSPTIELEQEDYKQLIEDQWSWRQAWDITNSAYLTV